MSLHPYFTEKYFYYVLKVYIFGIKFIAKNKRLYSKISYTIAKYLYKNMCQKCILLSQKFRNI